MQLFYTALLLLFNSLVIQAVGHWFEPSFNLLANRGVGKIIFMLLVVGHMLWLARRASLELNFHFKLKYFFGYFFVFFVLHMLMIILLNNLGSPEVSLKILGSIALGFIATFFLACAEEMIFRGILFRYFSQTLPIYLSIFLTSLIFMFSHNLSEGWRLGLGLFLLGVLLNLLFVSTKQLSASIGAHAGLVFVKVILRRVHFVGYTPLDLRQNHWVHLIFLILIIFLNEKRKNLAAVGVPLF
ncbi:MAG: CPBP family intramembrane glutamic endopeptidase [Myxococcaceae bacterium]